MYTQYQKFVALITLISLLLQSCGSNLMSIDRSTRSEPQESKSLSKQRIAVPKIPTGIEEHTAAALESQQTLRSAALRQSANGHTQQRPAHKSVSEPSTRGSRHTTIPARKLAPREKRQARSLPVDNPARKVDVIAKQSPVQHEPSPEPAPCSASIQQLEACTFTAAGGQKVRFRFEKGSWKAWIQELSFPHCFAPEISSAVMAAQGIRIESVLSSLVDGSEAKQRFYIEVLSATPPWAPPKVVCISKRGVRGGDMKLASHVESELIERQDNGPLEAEMLPANVYERLKTCLNQMRNEEAHIRQQASESLVELVSESRRDAKKLLLEVRKSLEDSNEYVRFIVIDTCVALAKALSEHANEVQPVLQQALRDRNAYVRSAAIGAVKTIVQTVPYLDIVPLVQQALQDSYENVRFDAMDIIRAQITVAPECLLTLLQDGILSQTLQDNNELIRFAAIDVLATLATQCPEYKTEIYSCLRAALLDDRTVSCNALTALGKFASYDVSSGLTAEIFQHLKVTLENERLSRYERSTAIDSLVRLMIKFKAYAPSVRPLLQNAQKDQDWWISSTAVEALKQISAEEREADHVAQEASIYTSRGLPVAEEAIKRAVEHEKKGLFPTQGQEGAGEEKQSAPPPTEAQSDAKEEKQHEPLPTEGQEEAQPVSRRALQHFRGEDPAGADQRLSENWYDEETMQHLASTLRQAPHLLKVVFQDYAHNNASFPQQIEHLQRLQSSLGKDYALFLCTMPGTEGQHYLFGLFSQNNLILINPTGIPCPQDFYKALADLCEKHLVEEIYLASLPPFQEEASHASCGPICAELLLHYGAMEEEALEESIGLLYSLAQAREAHGVQYQEADLNDLLPDTLRALVSEESSQGHIEALRHHHLERLEAASSKRQAKRPEQALFMQLTREGKRFQEIEAPEGAQVPPEATVTFEGKRISTSYWYEDREMSSLLQASLKRYSQEVSADRTCYTQADGSTITILGPLDNLSPQGLSEALLAYQRQPGLVVIPFNLGGLHWVGLLLAYAPSGALVRAEYYDALQGDVPPYLSDALRVHSLGREEESLRAFIKVQAPRLVTQANSSDCGPCTLENLLAHAGLGYTPVREAVRRRYQHLQWLEEDIQKARDQRYYDDFYRRQQRNEASCKMPVAPRKPQGPSEAEEARAEMARRREKIEGEHAQLLSLASTPIDLPLVEALLVDLQWLLEKEATFDPEEGEASAREYLLRLKADASLPWTKEQYEMIIELLEKAYGQELKRVTGAASRLLAPASRVVRLLVVLDSLAALHKERGERTGDLAHYTDAATLYQHALHVCEKELEHLEESTYQAQQEAAYSSLAQVKAAMLAKVHSEEASFSEASVEALREEMVRDKEEIELMRAEARERVDALGVFEISDRQEDEAAYIEGSRALFADIARGVKGFLARLYQECEEELGPAPCRYTVMGLGSMAMSQMTPYSGLAFCLLIEESPSWEELQARRDYFRQLTHLVNLRVVNLGESVIRESDYGVNFDPIGKRGLNLNLGGKTPLGRKDKHYDLIQPVEGMLRYLKNEGEKASHMDKNLPFILEKTCYVHGDEALYEAYEAGKRAFLMSSSREGSLPPHKTRALKKLLEGVVELDYNNPVAGTPGRRLIGNLEAFAPKLDRDQMGRLFDVKQEIYRLPDRLLYELANYYGVEAASAWDGVAKLSERGILSAEGAQHLQYAASFATMLRLRTYLHHGWHKDAMAVLESAEGVEAVQRAFRLPSEALQSGGSFFKYYYTALPLHEKMERFFKQAGQLALGEETPFFESEPFYESGLRRDATIYERLMQRRAALGCYEVLIKKEGDPEKRASLLSNAGVHYEALGEPRKALAFQEEALEMRQALFEGQHHPDLASSLNNVGSAYQALGQGQEALKHFKQALEMRQALFEGQLHPDIAMSLNNVGSAYQALGQGQEALKYKKQALEMRQALFEGQLHPDLASSMSNVGIAYQDLGQGQEALKYKKQALEMYRTLFQGQAHPDLASSLNNVGSAYQALGQGQEALKYKKQALEMRQALFEGQLHPDIAMSLNNVGSAYQALGQGQEALKYKKQALEMRQALFEGQLHPDLASSMSNVGIAYQDLGQGQEALKYKKQALEMYRTLFQGQAHPDLASSLNNVGSAYQALGQGQEALQYLKQALEMYRALFEGQHHPDIAMSLNNVGNAYGDLGQGQEALKYYEQALEMRQALFEGQHHPDLASSMSNVGVAYQALGQGQEALKYYEQALGIFRALFEGQLHPDLASSLNNVGSAYQALGQGQEALKYYEQALEMYRALFEGQLHPHLASSLNNVGSAYQALGQGQEALQYKKQALEMRQALFEGQHHPDIAMSLNNVGSAYQDLGQGQEALKYYEQALEMYRTLFQGQAHPDLTSSLNNVGSAYQALGQGQEALQYLKQALEMRQALFEGQHHPDLASSLNNVGSAYQALGQGQEALKYYEQALEMFRALFADRPHPHLAKVINNVGASYVRLGQMQQALAYLREGRAMLQALQLDPEQVERLNQVIGMLEMAEQNGLGERLQQAIAQPTSVAQHQQAAQEAYRNQDVAGAIRHYEEALQALPAEQEGSSSGLYHNLGCMHHVAALNTEEEDAAQTHLDSAAVAFEAAVAAGEGVRAGLYAEYANFLLATAQLEAAQHYLSQAVESGDTAEGLGYSALEQGTVHEALQGRIEQRGEVTVRGIDYAYFLLIHNYDTFVQSGIPLDKTQEEYLLAFKASIEQNAGEAGKEKEDEVAYYLLGTLQEAQGNEEAAKEAFAMERLAKRQVKALVEACRAGHDVAAVNLPMDTIEKDLHDAEGNPLICWMAQHEMVGTLEQALALGWNPNLANAKGVYPLHYAATKSPALTSRLLEEEAHPFVETPKGTTPAQAARKKGKMDTLAVLLPTHEALFFEDPGAFERSCEAYKQAFAGSTSSAAEALVALEIALQLGDAALAQAVETRYHTPALIRELSDKYLMDAAVLQSRLTLLLQRAVSETA